MLGILPAFWMQAFCPRTLPPEFHKHCPAAQIKILISNGLFAMRFFRLYSRKPHARFSADADSPVSKGNIRGMPRVSTDYGRDPENLFTEALIKSARPSCASFLPSLRQQILDVALATPAVCFLDRSRKSATIWTTVFYHRFLHPFTLRNLFHCNTNTSSMQAKRTATDAAVLERLENRIVFTCSAQISRQLPCRDAAPRRRLSAGRS